MIGLDVPGLPTSRLAFVFTDIESSTQLAQQLGSAWPDVVRRHREICRAAWTQFGGREIDTAGDGFFVVFEAATSAIAAAVAAQLALGKQHWPDRSPVRVRMGVHVGEAVEYDGSLVGYEVHRAARIAAAAHGGQLLLSSIAAAEATEPGCPGDFVVRDLGSHPLKDLAEAERLFQVVAPGLQVDFPAVRAAGPGGGRDADVPSTARNGVEIAPGAVVLADGRRVALTSYGMRIGRTPDNDLVLVDRAVSRHHCAIAATNGGFVLTDLASTHGTKVNDAELTRSRLLADGDRVQVGGTTLTVRWPV